MTLTVPITICFAIALAALVGGVAIGIALDRARPRQRASEGGCSPSATAAFDTVDTHSEENLETSNSARKSHNGLHEKREETVPDKMNRAESDTANTLSKTASAPHTAHVADINPTATTPLPEPLTIDELRAELHAHQQRMLEPYHLTDREREIVMLLLDGQTMGGIAERLVITERTVKFHSKNAYGKLGVHNKKELMQLFSELPSAGAAPSRRTPPPAEI